MIHNLNLLTVRSIVLLLMFTYSCSSDLDLYTNYVTLPVIYCQFDPTDSYCYVTLSKSFQSKTDARLELINREELQLNDAQITLEGWSGGYKAWGTEFILMDSKDLDTTASVYSRSLYRSSKKMNLRSTYLDTDHQSWRYEDFRLIVRSSEFDKPAYARIPVIHSPTLVHPLTPMDLNLYGDIESYFEFKVNQDESRYAEFLCDFYFQEYTDHWTNRMIRFTINRNLPLEKDPMIRLYYDTFFNKLDQAIDENPEVKVRRVRYMDFTLLISDVYFNDYHAVSSNGYSSDYAYYTNILNGMGLFSMKRKVIVSGINFDRTTLDSLQRSPITRHLNFVNY